jgi:hypothetical protein
MVANSSGSLKPLVKIMVMNVSVEGNLKMLKQNLRTMEK